MECLVAVMILLSVLAVLGGLGVGAPTRRGGTRRAYQHLAARLHGTYASGGLMGQPSVRFRYGSETVLIRAYTHRGRGKIPNTQVVFPWSDNTVRLEIYSAGPQRDLVRRTRQVRLDDTSFDRDFLVRGLPEGEVKSLLSDGAKWQINQLFAFHDHAELMVKIRNGRLVIDKCARLRRWDLLEQYTALCLALFDQFRITQSEGIEIQEDEEVQVIEDPLCKICGEGIGDDLVFCLGCRTPHHQDCWDYAGMCSVYGCGETRYAFPQPARIRTTTEPGAKTRSEPKDVTARKEQPKVSDHE